MKPKLLTLDKFHPQMQEGLEPHFEIIKPDIRNPDKVIRDNAEGIRAIYTNFNTVDRTLIEALPNLEVIAVGGVGYDSVNVPAALDNGVNVTHTPHVLTDDTADVALMMMLNILRRGVEGDAFIRAGLWERSRLPMGVTPVDKRVGIIGLGRIGSAIAKRCEAFKMKPSYFGPNKKDVAYTYYNDLTAMARDVDVIIAACVGGEKTKGIVNKDVIDALGAHGFFINIARGSVVDEVALVEALKNKTIAGAGLDVFADEPHVPQDLFKLDNVVLSPHIGSHTHETRAKMGQLVVGNLIAQMNGKELLTPVPECQK